MGCLYKRKKKRADGTSYELPTIWIKYYQNGRTVRESTETTKETVARRMLRAREGDVEHGIPIEPKLGRVTFEDAAKAFLNDYLINGRKTYKNAKHRIEAHLAPHFGGKRLLSITATEISAFVAARMADTIVVRRACVKRLRGGGTVEIPEQRRPVSAGEINRELATLKRMFSLAKKAGKLHHVPNVQKLREDNVRRGFFERTQFEAVRDHLPEALRPVASFAFLTGWRLDSEILPLEWRNVDMKAREVRLDPGTTKNREGRTYPFTAELERLMKELDAERERLKKQGRIVRHVFTREALVKQRDGSWAREPGQPIKVFRRAWRSACKAAGCPGRILHDFRRTAVRNLERAGVPRSAAMAMVGHKTEAIYRRYAIVDAGVLREAAAKIDRAANG